MSVSVRCVETGDQLVVVVVVVVVVYNTTQHTLTITQSLHHQDQEQPRTALLSRSLSLVITIYNMPHAALLSNRNFYN